MSHFSDHYKLELEHNYITRPGGSDSSEHKCAECPLIINNKEEYLQHLGVVHRKVEQFLPRKYRLPPDPEPVSPEKEKAEFICPIEDCGAGKETKKSYLIHLLMIHFSKEVEAEYKESFKEMNPKKCPECGMALLDNYLGFVKHLAVDHELVLKYVEKKDDSEQQENNEEPINEVVRDKNDVELSDESSETRSESPVIQEYVEPDPPPGPEYNNPPPDPEYNQPPDSPGHHHPPADPDPEYNQPPGNNVDLRAILDSDSDME